MSCLILGSLISVGGVRNLHLEQLLFSVGTPNQEITQTLSSVCTPDQNHLKVRRVTFPAALVSYHTNWFKQYKQVFPERSLAWGTPLVKEESSDRWATAKLGSNPDADSVRARCFFKSGRPHRWGGILAKPPDLFSTERRC